MNEEMMKALFDRLMADLEESKRSDLDPKDRKQLSEEIKAITNFITSNDSMNLEWEKFAYQKGRDLTLDKEEKKKRWFGIAGDILKVAGILIQAGFSIALVRSVLKFETDGTITTKMGSALFGRLINPKI